MKHALKEWNTTIEALGRGTTIAIWRKGGINDKPSIRVPFENFNIEQNRFVLFPTFTHQDLDKIKNDYWYLYDGSAGPNKDNQVKIKYWAEIEETILIKTFEQLLSISSELVNSEAHLKSSWNISPNHLGKVLLLRVYSFGDPILIPNQKQYEGCKSWIELNVDIPKTGSKPILSFKDFSRIARLINALSEQPSVPQKVTA